MVETNRRGATVMNSAALPAGLEFVNAAYVQRRLDGAGKTLVSLPATGTLPAKYKVAWPEAAQAISGVRDFDPNAVNVIGRPSAAAITAMDEAFQWVALAGDAAVQTKRLIWLRLLVHPLSDKHIWSWRKLAGLIGLDVRTLQVRHARGIDRIVTRLNRPSFIEQPGGSLP